MRAGRAIGAALAVLVAAAVSLVWLTPQAAAAGQQTGTNAGQADKRVDREVIVRKMQGNGPQAVTVYRGKDGQPNVTSHVLQGGPAWTAVAGGGPRLGVEIRDVTADDVTKLKLPGAGGVVVELVTKDSAAEKAGMKAGDVVVQFDGEAVRSAQQFTRLVRETVAGRTVKVAVFRDGRRVELSAAPASADDVFDIQVDEKKLEELNENAAEGLRQFRFERRVPAPGPLPRDGGVFRWRQQAPAPGPLPEGDVLEWFGERGDGNMFFSMSRGRLGVTVQDLTPDLAGYFGVKDGLLVNSVQAESPAAKAGIKAGDVITSVDGKAMTTADALVRELAGKNGEVTVGLTRDKKPLSLKATLEERKPPVRRRTVVGKPA